MIYQCHNTSNARCTYVDINITCFLRFNSSVKYANFYSFFIFVFAFVIHKNTIWKRRDILRKASFFMHCNFRSIIFLFFSWINDYFVWSQQLVFLLYPPCCFWSEFINVSASYHITVIGCLFGFIGSSGSSYFLACPFSPCM